MEAITEAPTVRKRGRPPKNAQAADDKKVESQEQQDSEAQTVPKKAKKVAVEGKQSKNEEKAHKLYEAMVKKVSKKYSSWLAKQSKQSTPRVGYGITADDYMQHASTHIGTVEKILELSPRQAFFAISYLADTCIGNLNLCKACGWGEGEDALKSLDECMVSVIDARIAVEPSSPAANDPGVVPLVLNKQEENFSKLLGRSTKNKREYKEKAEYRRNDLEDEVEKKATRRALAKDWATTALDDLITQQKEVEQYGIDQYFFSSISKLQGIKNLEPES